MFDAAVERALHGLPERHRRVIQLVDIDGLRYTEAAIALDVSIGTIMSRPRRHRLPRGARRLQRYLDGEADDLTSRRIAAHLERCQACGMNAATYAEIKAALSRTSTPGDQLALRRLQAFADSVATGRNEADESGRRAQ